ncbi:hypothetical protein HERIO_2255 [Hepatospora eriocheir]|uniref:Uncharacterized protein n=1 Tax=Hepatospora eriocheir TaxID=1081669 RepID=A0A1X0Q7H4_9MICR|nr:hypothetical protein HERIO_2255 [Hepatospora eriocheir]
MIILIKTYNVLKYNSLTRFTINFCIFKYLDNKNDDLRKEILQLNIKLSNFLFIESEKYDIYLSYYVKKYILLN